MSSAPLSERIRNLTGWFDPEFAPEAQIVNGLANEVRNLENTVCLPPPQIIRTVEELQDLDPDTLLIESDDPGDDAWTAQVLMQAIRDGYGTSHDQPDGPFPAVVVTPAEQVRAARNALQKETNND